jgi:hypothetical protein
MIVRGLLQQHYDSLASPAPPTFTKLLQSLTNEETTARHALLSEISPNCKSLGCGAPVTGTAIHPSTEQDWDIVWAKWISILQLVPGFWGIAGKSPPSFHSNTNIANVHQALKLTPLPGYQTG